MREIGTEEHYYKCLYRIEGNEPYFVNYVGTVNLKYVVEKAEERLELQEFLKSVDIFTSGKQDTLTVRIENLCWQTE